MKSSALLLFVFSLLAQQAAPPPAQMVSIHITAVPQPKADARLSFGNLGNDIPISPELCLDPPLIKVQVATARVRQAVTMPDGYTLLDSDLAVAAIQAAQGRNPWVWVTRVVNAGGIATDDAVTAEAVAKKTVPRWAAGASLGVSFGSIIATVLIPALQTHAVTSVTQMLPEILSFDPATGACVKGWVLVNAPKKAKTVPTFTQDVSVAAVSSPVAVSK